MPCFPPATGFDFGHIPQRVTTGITATLFATAFVLVFVYVPFVAALSLWDRFHLSTGPDSVSAVEYEGHLAELLAAVNLMQGQPVPVDVREQLVKVIKLFERGVVDIIGPRRRDYCRLLWIVRDNNGVDATTWARKRDKLKSGERDVVDQCLNFKGWFVALNHVTRNQAFVGMHPEGIEDIVVARNLKQWKIGFVLIFDRHFLITQGMKERLKAHMLALMPLWELDTMHQVMVELQRQDWEVEVS